MIESLETLKGRGPKDLEMLSVFLAARMLVLGGVTDSAEEANQRVRTALASGQGLEKFRQIIAQQGGDPRVADDYSLLPAAPHRRPVPAPRPGWVVGLDAELIGRAGMLLGAGRNRVEDTIDPGVGVTIRAHRGEQVRPGDPLVELHYRDEGPLEAAVQLVGQAYAIEDAAPVPQPLLLDMVH